MNLNFFLPNQDFVWGLGLMLSGAIIAFVVIRYNAGTFVRNLVLQRKATL